MAKTPHPRPSLKVGVGELRGRLSHYLAEVADGRAVVVTDRGRPVARLTGVDQIPDGWQRPIDDGLIRMPAKKATSSKTRRKVKATYALG
ncbi:MAG: type II toxin-antitoxin system prevent-host-death family antitoxin [Actinomycetota bacterium]